MIRWYNKYKTKLVNIASASLLFTTTTLLFLHPLEGREAQQAQPGCQHEAGGVEEQGALAGQGQGGVAHPQRHVRGCRGVR